VQQTIPSPCTLALWWPTLMAQHGISAHLLELKNVSTLFLA